MEPVLCSAVAAVLECKMSYSKASREIGISRKSIYRRIDAINRADIIRFLVIMTKPTVESLLLLRKVDVEFQPIYRPLVLPTT